MTAEAYPPPIDAPLPAGRVLLREGDRLTVRVEGAGGVEDGQWVARRAASCLLRPEPGDRVLLTLSPEPFVLAVLARDGSRCATLEVDGGARLRSTGTLELSGDEGLRLLTRRTLSMLSRALKVHSGATELASETLTAVAKRARASFDDGGLASRTLDVVAERLTQRLARAYRSVTEHDQLRARHLDYRADHSARISSQNTVVTAREVVKVDGEQVHIG